MKKLSLKYVGTKTVRALLERYACPTPFHIVRMRFLGNIATPKLDASPIETIKSFWGGELPEFDNRAAVNELFEAMLSLWNELARHQSITKPVQLVRMAIKPDPGNLIRLCQTRTEELEGFIDGLFGDERSHRPTQTGQRSSESSRRYQRHAARHSRPHGKRTGTIGVGRGHDGYLQECGGTLTHRGERTSRGGTFRQASTPTGHLDHRSGQADNPLI